MADRVSRKEIFVRFVRKTKSPYVFFLYVMCTIVYTWPLAIQLNRSVIGDGDTWKFVWNLWYFKENCLSPQNLVWTNSLFYPHGDYLMLQPWSHISCLLSIPLQFVFSLITAYNLISLLSFPLAAMGMYLVLKHFNCNRINAWIGGFFFSFNAYHFAHARGHLNIISYQWVPFFLLFFIRTIEQQENRKRNALLSILFLILVGLSDWYYFVFSLIGAAFIAIIPPRTTIPALKQRIIILLQVSLAAIIIVSPLLYGMIAQAAKGIPPQTTASSFSNDLTSFFIPGPNSSHGVWFSAYWQKWSGNPAEWGAFVPWSVLILCLVFAFSPKLAHKKWLTGWIVTFGLLSLGPVLHVNGTEYKSIILPYKILDSIPGLRIMQSPGRFQVMMLFGICLLIGLGLERFRHHHVIKKALFMALLAIEVSAISIPLSTPDISPFYRWLAETKDNQAAVIDLNYGSKAMFYQTIHGHPLAGRSNMLARESLAAIESVGRIDGLREIMTENEIRGFHVGWPMSLDTNALPENFHLQIVFDVNTEQFTKLSETPVEVVSSLPFQLIVGHKLIPTKESMIGTHIGALRKNDFSESGANTPIRIGIDLKKSGWPSLMLRIAKTDLLHGTAEENIMISPPTAIQKDFGNKGCMSIIYENVTVSGSTASNEKNSLLNALSCHGYKWIVSPFYGNDHFTRTALGLQPFWVDQYVTVYRLPDRSNFSK